MAQRQAVAVEVSIPAPIGGWNTRDALSMMAPTDAPILQNWFPRPDSVVVRGGTKPNTTGLGGSVDTLMEYAGGAAAHKLLGAANGKIFDVSAAGAVGAALATGFASNQWQYAMTSTPGGQFLTMVDGADAPQQFNGTVITAPSITGAGLTPSNLVDVTQYRGRLYFAEKGTLHLWYLPVNSIAGVALLYDLGQFCKLGGSIAAISSWTMAGGEDGVNDVLLIMTSEGEALIYSGNDPSSVTSFQQAGRYVIGKPIGRRCLLRYGKDLILLLQDGAYEAGSLLQEQVEGAPVALSDMIRPTFTDQAALTQGQFGWQMLYYPLGQRLIVNVPVDAQGTINQFVMNSISKKWCSFTGIAARCWSLFNGIPYFGDAAGNVWLGDTGNVDNGVAISAFAQQAYSAFDVPGRVKHIKMVRPKFTATAQPGIGVNIDVEYGSTPFPAVSAFGPPGSLWNVALWNIGLWGGGASTISQWLGASAVGQQLSIKVAAQSTGVLKWFATDVVGESGGIMSGNRYAKIKSRSQSAGCHG
jgi:hypothetical protein